MPTTESAPQRLALTVDEAAASLGISRAYLYKLVKAGDIETVKIGRSRRVTPDAIRAFLATKAASA